MKNRIKELRERRRLSPLQLAARTGVDVGAIRAWESGKRDPMVNNALCLAETLGVTIDEIWYDLPKVTALKPRKMTKLEERRRGMGKTLREVSEATGIAHTTLAYYEKVGGLPPIYNAMLLARCLGTTVEELFSP